MLNNKIFYTKPFYTKPFYTKPFFNKKLSDYCLQSTMESIQKIVEKQKKERKIPKINTDSLALTTHNSNPNIDPNNLNYFILFLSISSFMYFFYKRIK